MAKNPRRFRVSDSYGSNVRVAAYRPDGNFVSEVRLSDGDDDAVFHSMKPEPVDMLITDLITAREHVFGPWSRDTSANSVPAASGDRALLLALVRSLKEVTSSRAEYARCEAAIKMLGG